MPALREASAGLPAAIEEYEAARSALAETISLRDELRTHRTEEQAWLRRCSELEEEREGLLAARNEASHRQAAYDQLAAAFGKGGLQALLIEQAIPELETYANDILGRVTEHRMSLKLETQRERRGGGDPRETLDISSDELWHSQLRDVQRRRVVPHRLCAANRAVALAGAPVGRSAAHASSSEGFGSQDAAGLERLVEAIQATRTTSRRYWSSRGA